MHIIREREANYYHNFGISSLKDPKTVYFYYICSKLAVKCNQPVIQTA